MNKFPIYDCIIDNNDDTTGIYAISFVDCPANEVDFITLSRQQNIHLSKDSQKQILTGVILQPEQLIYRQSPQMGEYYIKFSAAEIEKISHKMMKQSVALYNTTHQHEQCLSGNYLVELWIIENPGLDKSRALGFKDLPKGTLMCSYKVDDQDYWNNEVMAGNVKGFSLEGFFNQVSMSKIKNKTIKKLKMNRKKSILDRLASLLLTTEDVIKKDATKSGEPYVLFVLADGTEVYVDQDGFATLDEEQTPAGEHKLADGSILVIDEEGLFVETKAPSDTKEGNQEATAPQTMHKHIRLEEFQPKTAEAVKAKIAAMQDIIDELMAALDEANQTVTDTNKEINELRKKTPSAQPLKQKSIFRNPENLTMSQRMAVVLNQTIDRRK